MRVMSRRMVAVSAGLAVSAVVGLVLAHAAAAGTPVSASSTDNGGSIVEDYSYPGAADILATYNVKLISGDGHILFADCATPPTGDIGLIKVYTTEQAGANGSGLVCFKVTANHGRLDLEVPGVYEIRGDGQKPGTGHNITATVKTATGQPTEQPVAPDGSTQFGIGTSPTADPTTLLQLKVTP